MSQKTRTPNIKMT